jgi:hypothetical protein
MEEPATNLDDDTRALIDEVMDPNRPDDGRRESGATN